MQLRRFVWPTALGIVLLIGCGSITKTPGSGSGGGASDGGDAGQIPGGGSNDGGVGGLDAGPGGGGKSTSFTISVRVNGNGAVHADALGLDCRSSCDASVPAGTRVSFIPVPSNGWTFDGWGGLCSGNGGCEFTVDGDRTLWATFVQNGGAGGGGGSGDDGGSGGGGGGQDGGQTGGFAVELHPTNAPGCSGVMPSSMPEPRTVTLELQYQPSNGDWFDGLAVDGLGDVAVELNSDHSDTPTDERRQVIYDLDGGIAGQVPGGFAKSQPDGFVTVKLPMDSGQQYTLSGWTRSATNSFVLDRAIPDPRYVTFGCTYALPPLSGALIQCWENDGGTWVQYYDESLQASSGRHQIPDGGTLVAIDARGMVIENGPTDMYWMDTAGARHSGSIDAGAPPLSNARQLIGGGFDTSQGVLPPDATDLAPRPSWLSSRDRLPLVFVRGASAYAIPSFVSSTHCQQQIEMLLPDGTSCGTIQMSEANDCPGGTPMVGARGTVLTIVRNAPASDGGTHTLEYRVFPRLLE